MANPEHLQILEQGVEAWNAWRDNHRDLSLEVDLREANLAGADLSDADLTWVDLTVANLTGANLTGANLTGAYLIRGDLTRGDLSRTNLSMANLSMAYLSWANLTGANLTGAYLTRAYLTRADLQEANLLNADLQGANLTEANLTGANLSGARLYETIFSNTNFADARGIETCHHTGPSTLDHRTLAKSGQLPLAFLRGCGLPDTLIDYLPALFNAPFQFYSCFISYASTDQTFAERLHADLQSKGVRCWFAPEDMKIGDRLRPRIDETIRLYDKLLLVLSTTSVASQWVEQEVETALARERQQGTTILFPVRIDNAVMTLETGWPMYIRNTRNIGDFQGWETHSVYQKAFDRLLRDLTAPSAPRLN